MSGGETLTEPEPLPPVPAKHFSVTFIAAIAGFAGLLFGYDTGIIAAALLFIDPEFGLSSFESGLVVASVPIGAVLGAALAGRLSDRYGRRAMILLAALVFVVGALGSAASQDLALLVLSRLVLGAAVGLASACAPVYISEVAPPDQRGRLVTFFQLAVTIGIVVAYGVGLAFDASEGWRWMLGLGAVPALFLGLGMLRAPQSPRWLVIAGRNDDARGVLSSIREGGSEVVDEEMRDIEHDLAQDVGTWRDLWTPVARAALFVGVGLAVLQQISGINTVIYYAPTIIQLTGVDSSAASILAAVGVGIVNVGMTVVAIKLLDRAGRKPLLLIGSGLMGLALGLLGITFLGSETTADSWIAVICLMVYVGAFACSLGPIFWLMNAELYNTRIRSKAAATGTMSNWTFNFIVSLTFLPLIDLLGNAGTFFFYAAVCGLTLLFCLRFVPETKNKPLEEIESIFRARVGETT